MENGSKEINAIIGATCECGGKFVRAISRQGFYESINGRYAQYEIKNYPHISCEHCGTMIHIDQKNENSYNHMKEIGRANAKSSEDCYVVDYKKYKKEK